MSVFSISHFGALMIHPREDTLRGVPLTTVALSGLPILESVFGVSLVVTSDVGSKGMSSAGKRIICSGVGLRSLRLRR